VLSHFTLNWYAVPVAIVSTLILFVGVFVYAQNRKSPANLSFFIICLCVNLWLYGISLVYSARDPVLALALYRTLPFLGVAFVSSCVYWFSVVWLRLYEKQRRLVFLALAGSLFFYAGGLLSGSSFRGVYKYFWGYYPQYGGLNYLFLAFFFAVFFGAFTNFYRAYLAESDPIRKTQIKFIAIAFLISFSGSVDYLPKLIHAPIYPLGYLCVFFWIMTVAYAIVRYKVMDIETVIHQTILWVVTSSIVIFPIIGIFYALREWYREASAGAFALFTSVLFFAFFFYLKTIQPQIDHLFKRRVLDLEQSLVKFNDALVHLKSLSELVSYIVRTIQEAMYVEKVQILLKDKATDVLVRVDTSPAEARDLALSHPFVRWLEAQDKVAQVHYVDLDPRFETIKEAAKPFFRQWGAEVTVPLVLNGELIGLINLGRKINLKGFRNAELKFLSELRRAATIAFSNTMRLIEVQESLRKWNEDLEKKVKQRTRELEEAQKQLVQAEKLATIGTLAGGVAHEINNPLTAVLTNAQMLKLSLTGGDEAECVSLIEEGAKRCQTIVQKLMKYARKPVHEELKQEVDLNQVIDNVLAFIQYQLEQENISVVKRFSALAKVKGVANELEQVFTNIILNAKDAIKAASGAGTIEIATFEKNGTVYAQVKDNGVGIAQENLSKIFDPFFTTKDVGKGTGLGLSITYGIIEKHGGKIEVASEQDHGTTFLVSIPKYVE
jgi:signal transduction histidine kinase